MYTGAAANQAWQPQEIKTLTPSQPVPMVNPPPPQIPPMNMNVPLGPLSESRTMSSPHQDNSPISQRERSKDKESSRRDRDRDRDRDRERSHRRERSRSRSRRHKSRSRSPNHRSHRKKKSRRHEDSD